MGEAVFVGAYKGATSAADRALGFRESLWHEPNLAQMARSFRRTGRMRQMRSLWESAATGTMAPTEHPGGGGDHSSESERSDSFPTYLTPPNQYMDLPPEILVLAKTSPWGFVAWLTIRQLGALLSPFASIFAIRLARNDKERATFLEHRRIERRPAIGWPWRKLHDGKEEK